MYEISLNDNRTGIQRLGSHCTEKQIDQVRILFGHDHRFERIIRSSAMLRILKGISNSLFQNEHPHTKKKG